jgi:predicted MFS family arabinose efflux permease
VLRERLGQRAGGRRRAVSATALAARPGPAWRTRAWGIVAALSVTETVSWGIVYYAFAVFLVPMQRDLGFSAAQLTGAFSLALALSAPTGIAVGRHLDRHSPRALMTAGSVAAVVLVVAWSQVSHLVAFYVLWAGMGLVMAAVLYEPAFTVVAKHFTVAAERRRAMTAMTLVAALASFIFLPLSQALIETHGWRDALLVLAAILAAVTVPLHALVLRPAPAVERTASRDRSVRAGAALRSLPFWLLTGAFVLASLSTIAMMVFAIPFLLERGYSPAFAAFAVGLVGVSQIPGRLLFAPLGARVPLVFALIALGAAIVVGLHSTAAVVTGLVLLGMGNGMATLARATAIADRYGSGAYGTIAGVAGGLTTAARAAGPFAAALYAGAVGYTALLWTLAGLALAASLLACRAEHIT